MSWIKYENNPAHPSPGVKHVKKLLTALAKKYDNIGDSSYWIFITLTGNEERDKASLRFYEKDMYSKLARDIQKSLKENDEQGYDGFYTRDHVKRLEFIQEIQGIVYYINNNDY